MGDKTLAPKQERSRQTLQELLKATIKVLDESGLEGDDYYKVALWPADPAEVTVMKQWAPAAAA